MTPVLHRDYRRWRGHKPVPRKSLGSPFGSRFALASQAGPVKQFAQVAYLCKHKRWWSKFAPWPLVWYGTEGQGVDLFHQRLKENS